MTLRALPLKLALPARAAVAIWVFVFVAFLGTYVTTYLVTVRVPTQLLFAGPLIVWAAFRLRGPRSALDVAILAALAILGLVAFVGVDPLGSLETAGLGLAYALLFWCMRDEDAAWLRGTIATAVTLTLCGWLVAVAIAWIGEKLAWYAAGGSGFPNLESHQVFVWGSANAYPVLVLFALAFLTWMPAGAVRRIAGILIASASVVVVPFSAGRAGWLGIAVAVVAYEALAGWPHLRSATAWLGRRAWGRPSALVLGAAAVIGLILGSGRITQAIATNLDSRWRIWEQGMGIFAADPITGSGPGSYSWMRLLHVPDFQDRVGVVLSHNVIIQTLADGGILLLTGFLGAAVCWLVAVWRGQSAAQPRQRVAAAATAGIAAASLLDDFSYLPAIVAMAVALAAWSLPRPADSPSAGRPARSLALPVVVALLLVVALPATFLVERARLVAVDARQAAIQHHWADAAARFDEAFSLYPTNPAYALGLGLSLAELGETNASVAAYDAGRSLSPGDPRFAGALAGLAMQSSESARAESLLEEAARHSNDPQYAWRLATARWASGDPDGARDMYAIAVALRSSLFESVPDEVDRSLVRARLDEAAQRVGSISGQPARRPVWDVALADDDLPVDAPAPWQAISLANVGAIDAAESTINIALARAPYDEDLYLARVAVARFACDRAGLTAALKLAPAAPEAPSGLTLGRDPAYREPGIGDYQPSGAPRISSVDDAWPSPFVRFPACD